MDNPLTNTLDLRRPTQPSPPRPSKRKYWPPNKRLLVILAALAVIVILAAILLTQINSGAKDPFPATIRKSVSIPLYYPSQLSAGYTIDTKSISKPDTNVVTFTVSDKDDKKFFISESPVPTKNFDFKTFYGNFSNIHRFQTPHGEATSGTISNGQTHAVSIVIDNKTWIILNSNSSVPISTLELAVASLTLSN